MACALTHKAIRDGFTALYTRAPRLLRDLAVARVDGTSAKLLDRIARIDVLIAGDWAVAPLADTERRDLLEICDDRYATRSTILAVCNTSALTDYIRSKRSRFITLFQALTKSRTNFSFPSSAA